MWVNISSGNGLLPHVTKPLPKPVGSCDNHLQFHEIPHQSVDKISLKITNPNFYLNLRGTSDLN